MKKKLFSIVCVKNNFGSNSMFHSTLLELNNYFSKNQT